MIRVLNAYTSTIHNCTRMHFLMYVYMAVHYTHF